MQYQVPQFIEVEDKIIGPLTLKQFLWLLAGAGILLVVWALVDLAVFIILAIPIVALSGLLAFLKVNGRPFIYFLGSLFHFIRKPKMFIWGRKEVNKSPE